MIFNHMQALLNVLNSTAQQLPNCCCACWVRVQHGAHFFQFWMNVCFECVKQHRVAVGMLQGTPLTSFSCLFCVKGSNLEQQVDVQLCVLCQTTHNTTDNLHLSPLNVRIEVILMLSLANVFLIKVNLVSKGKRQMSESKSSPCFC